MSKPGDWMENKQTLADGVHFALGYSILFTSSVFGNLTAIIVATSVLAPFVLIKEYWYDLRYETDETVATSTQDVIGWGLGMLSGWLAFALMVFLHR